MRHWSRRCRMRDRKLDVQSKGPYISRHITHNLTGPAQHVATLQDMHTDGMNRCKPSLNFSCSSPLYSIHGQHRGWNRCHRQRWIPFTVFVVIIMVASIVVAIEEVGPQVVSTIIVGIEEVDCSWFMSCIIEWLLSLSNCEVIDLTILDSRSIYGMTCSRYVKSWVQ